MLPSSQEILIQAINYPDFLREASLYGILLRLEKPKNRTYKVPIRIPYMPPLYKREGARGKQPL